MKAGEYSVIHYDQSNGLPGSYGYIMYQDRRGYLWIATENGLARFNGYEFKVFTTKDGLPDNEILAMSEDNSGRLWLCPFANALCYIENDKVYTAANNPLLGRLHFKTRPSCVITDAAGTVFICEEACLYGISNRGRITKYLFSIEGDPTLIFLKDTGNLKVYYHDAIYRYDGREFKKTTVIPCSWKPFQWNFIFNTVAVFGIKQGMDFVNKAISSQQAFYNKETEINKLVALSMLPGGKVALSRQDGCFLADVATARITDTFLYGNKVAPCMMLTDGAMWMGTHGNGVFRYLSSPVKSIEQSSASSSVLYIRGKQNGMYSVLEKGRFIDVTFDGSGKLKTGPVVNINNSSPYQVFVYLGQNSKGEWLSGGERLYKYRHVGEPPNTYFYSGYCKDVFEEDEEHILVASGLKLLRIDKTDFAKEDILFPSRVTSVTKSAGIIYAGTLNGLLAGTVPGSFKKIFSQVPSLNNHIVKLCAGVNNDVWVANNNAVLSVINGNELRAVIGQDNGLQCSRVCALKASSKFIWAGTDNGLYAIQNTPPFTVVRHLSYATGLNSNQVNCLDICDGKIWIGTTKGINYFNEQDIFRQLPSPQMIINSITNGTDDIVLSKGMISLAQKTLTVDFDVIDHAGGQKPQFQYRMNSDSSWINIENSNLYFPSIPYGDFVIHLQALSPNWGKPIGYTLRFYRPYPFYLQWWFVTIASLAFAGVMTGSIVLFIRRVRRKDQEKLSVQRNLLQLEQLALQGQMNPHFIFNCISAIKQYYSNGNMQKANSFVDIFASLIRQTFEMGTETFVSLDKELNYLGKYLSIEQARFDYSFDFSISKKLSLSEKQIPVPAMLLQPLAENAVRHGVRHLSGRRGEIKIAIVQDGDRIEITITDNGVGREKSRRFGHMFQDIVQVTSTTVNAKRIDILNRLFEQQIIHKTEDVINDHNEIAGTRVVISYPLEIRSMHL